MAYRLPFAGIDDRIAAQRQNYALEHQKLMQQREERRLAKALREQFNQPSSPSSSPSTNPYANIFNPYNIGAKPTTATREPVAITNPNTYNVFENAPVISGILDVDPTPDNTFATAASPYAGIDANPYAVADNSANLYTPAATAASAVQSAGIPTGNFDPANYPESATNHKFPKVSGPGKIFYRDKTPGYFQKDGHKNEVANNPGNIASKKNLYFGAIGRLVSKYNGEDHADSSLLVYDSPQAGFKALDAQMGAKSYNGPIKKTFAKWQKKGFSGKLNALHKYGIDTNKSYRQLSNKEKFLMRKVWAEHEGWRGKTY